MDDTIERVAERLARLEVTVAKSSYESGLRDQALSEKIDQRFGTLDGKVDERFETLDRKIDDRFETLDRKIDDRFGTLDRKIDDRFGTLDRKIDERFETLNNKIDVNTESLRSDIQTVLAAVDSLAGEMRRTTDSIRKEHAADRDVFKLAIADHGKRLTRLEQNRSSQD